VDLRKDAPEDDQPQRRLDRAEQQLGRVVGELPGLETDDRDRLLDTL